MVKLRSVHYLLLLVASLLLSIIYLNMVFNITRAESVSHKWTGAFGAIPATALPSSYVFIITMSVIVFGYFLWVWGEAETLKEKYKK